MKVLDGVFFGIFEVERVEPLIYRVIDAEFYVRFGKRALKLRQKVDVRTYIHAVPVPRVVRFPKAEAVVVL